MSEVEFVHKVRPYTINEKEVVRPADVETPADKLQRVAATQVIDEERYRQAAVEHPDMAPHFDRLIDVSRRAVASWAEYYEPQIPAEEVAAAAPLTTGVV